MHWSALKRDTDLAVEAVRKFHEAVNDNLDVRNRADLSDLRKTLLAEPLKFFEQLREDLQTGPDTSPATTMKFARANLELARLSDEIGSKPDAVRSYQEAIATLGDFEFTKPSSGDRGRHDGQIVLADALGQLGTVLGDIGKMDEARKCFKRALRISAELVQTSSAPYDKMVHASLLRRLAVIEAPEFPDKAISLLDQAAAGLRTLASERPILPGARDLLASIYASLGSALRARGRVAEGAARFRDSIAAYEVLVRDSPGNHLYRQILANACFNYANLQLKSNNDVNVQASCERAEGSVGGVGPRISVGEHYRSLLVAVYGTLGIVHEHQRQFEEARAALNRSREIAERLVPRQPGRPPVSLGPGKNVD